MVETVTSQSEMVFFKKECVAKGAVTQESDLRALLLRQENFSGRRWTRKGSRMVT